MKVKVRMMSSILITFLLLTLPVLQASADQPFDISAKSAILIDAATGTILYEKNIHEALPPASVTKIMTMLLAMEALDNGIITLEDQVTVSAYASSMGGTQLYLEPGEVKTVEELMKGVAIRSANDASVAMAEYIAGTEEVFVQRMNQRAKELGMENTTFVNSNGLPTPGHVTSAYDIALMSRELLKHPTVHRWLTTWMDTVVVGRKQATQELVNTNRMIRFYDGATGIKTGYTTEALHCLSASATRGDATFIAVILGAPTSQTRFDEAGKLLDYAFANYNTIDIYEAGGLIDVLPVEKGKQMTIQGVAKEDFSLLVKKGANPNVEKTITFTEKLRAPLAAGDKIGEVRITLDGTPVGTLDIITPVALEKAGYWDMLSRMFLRIMGH